MKLYNFQTSAIEQVKNKKNVLFAYDMGLGKTYLGARRLIDKNKKTSLVICQKSKINDWIEILKNEGLKVYDLTKKKNLDNFNFGIGVINYELAWRRKQLTKFTDFTLLLDESSLLQNEKCKKTKFILKLKYDNVILLSGTVCNGNYEKLWSQLKLLGWEIKKGEFYRRYCVMRDMNLNGVKFKIVVGYKNTKDLKKQLFNYGGIFKTADEVLELPKQNFIDVLSESSKIYKEFEKTKFVEYAGHEFVGDYELTARLNGRLLCSVFNKQRLKQVRDLIDSTNDRIIIFYNFDMELTELKKLCKDRPLSFVNGKKTDLKNYTFKNDTITLVQYQAGAMGLNLQLANKIIFFSLPDGRAELLSQALKRVHRIGQERAVFYYLCWSKNTVEQEIYNNLKIKDKRIKYLWTH